MSGSDDGGRFWWSETRTHITHTYHNAYWEYFGMEHLERESTVAASQSNLGGSPPDWHLFL